MSRIYFVMIFVDGVVSKFDCDTHIQRASPSVRSPAYLLPRLRAQGHDGLHGGGRLQDVLPRKVLGRRAHRHLQSAESRGAMCVRWWC